MIWKSPVCHGGGKNPNWPNASTCMRRTNEDVVYIEVWDKDNASSDDMIAQGVFPVAKVEKGGKTTDWINLTYKGKDAG